MHKLSAQQALHLRLASQRLLKNGGAALTTPIDTAQALFAYQAQELAAGQLSMRARGQEFSAADVDRARQVDRSLAWTWCLRGTLHLLAAEDARWLVPLVGPGVSASYRTRRAQLGWDDSNVGKGVALVASALEKTWEEGAPSTPGSDHPGNRCLTRKEIAELLQANHLPYEGQATVHLMLHMAMEGRVLRGPDRPGKKGGPAITYVLFERWLGPVQRLPQDEALARLAHRYLHAFAPAGPEDLAVWSGLRIGDARRAWELIGSELEAVEAHGKPAWILKTDVERLSDAGNTARVVSLLPRFDTYWLGWVERSFALAPAYYERVYRGGIIDAALLIDGRAAGTWKTRPRASCVDLEIIPFEPLDSDVLPLVEADAREVGRFLGQPARLIITSSPEKG